MKNWTSISEGKQYERWRKIIKFNLRKKEKNVGEIINLRNMKIQQIRNEK